MNNGVFYLLDVSCSWPFLFINIVFYHRLFLRRLWWNHVLLNVCFQRREVEYDEYLKDRLVEAKNEFRALLRETKVITYRSYEMIKDSDKHHKDIIDILKVLQLLVSKVCCVTWVLVQNDRRYLVLECIADERKRMLESYIDELHRKGPPPPPTATNPGERLKRPAATWTDSLHSHCIQKLLYLHKFLVSVSKKQKWCSCLNFHCASHFH